MTNFHPGNTIDAADMLARDLARERPAIRRGLKETAGVCLWLFFCVISCYFYLFVLCCC